MRRKKLANKIVSILMAGLMLASTPMSALATDVELTDGIQQIEVQSASEDGEIPVEDNADLEEESTVEEEADEDIIAEEEVTADEQELSEESGEEVILGDSEEAADEVATQADEGDTAVGGTPTADAEISVSISVKGEFAKAKDGSVMIQKKVTVTDTNNDGKLSVDEALAATHDTYYEGGAASGYASEPSQYGTSLEKLWGDTSKVFGYWDNDQSCMSLDDEVKKDDNLVAFVYKDTTSYSDAYSKFTSKEYTIEAGSPLTVGVEKAGYGESGNVVFSACTDAELTVYDSDFKALSSEAYSIEGYQVTFKNPGHYYLMASKTSENILVPTVASVTVTESKSMNKILVNPCEHGTVTPSVEQATPGTTVTLTVKPWGGYGVKELKAVYTQDGAEKAVTIAEDNSFVMPEADVTISATFEQTVWLTKVGFSTVIEGNNPVYVEFKDNVSEYEVSLNNYDYENKVYMYLSTNKETYTTATVNKPTTSGYKATNFQDNTWKMVGSYMNDGITYVGVKLTDTKQSYSVNYEGLDAAEYSFNLIRKASLKSLKMENVIGEVTFNRAVYDYNVAVAHSTESISLSAEGYKDRYNISVNDKVVTSGDTITVPLNWDANDQMIIPVTVGGKDVQTTTYTIHLTREPEEDKPTIRQQPVGGQKYVGPITAEETTALSVQATANGVLTYQWYKNTVNSVDGATLLTGATENSYHPEFEEKENRRYYYYCTVTSTNEKGTFTTNTDIVPVTVLEDPTPYNVRITYADGTEIGEKGVKLNVKDKVALGVQYDTKADKSLLEDDVDIVFRYVDDQGRMSLSAYTDVWSIYNKHGYFYCTVNIVINGKTYTAYSKTEDEKGIEFTVCATGARPANINAQGTDTEYVVGGEDIQPLSIGLSYPMSAYGNDVKQAEVNDGVVNSWQWMVSEDGKFFTAINSDSARGISEQPSGRMHTVSYVPESSDVACKRYYKCRFTTEVNSYDGNTYRAYTDSDVIEVTFSEIQGFEGEGTKASPYLIQTEQDLKLLAEYVNEKKLNFSGKTLKLTADLTLPNGWTQIGTEKNGDTAEGKNLIPFSGTFDGNGHTITIPAGGKTVFNRVREAKICNLNIYGSQIEGYGLVDGYTIDKGPDGNYQTGVPKSVTISNCRILEGSKVLKAGFIGGGASGKNEITIQNCEVEAGVIIGYDQLQSDIGSIAGLFNGTIQNCRSYATVYGVDNVGGILGSKGQSMGPCRVISCYFGGTVIATGSFVGGIAGGGYNNTTAPNSPCVTLQYNSCDGTITGNNNVGGIFGGEGGVTQCWENGIGYIQNNQFAGTVSAPEGANVGGIIGYMRSIDRFNIIENNYWKTGCGAASGIGEIKSIDTTSRDYSVEKDFVVDEVCIPSKAEDMPDITKAVVTDLVLEGTYKTTYYLGEELDLTGMQLTAVYSDGSETHPALTETTISGYDKTKRGEQTVSIKYGDAVASFVVIVLKKSNDTITVSFTLLGDKVHDASQDGEIHTLKSGNLETWVAEKKYEVNQNATVKDVLEKVLAENNMTCENPSGNYVTYITNGTTRLGEFDNGVETSGWMYTLNGTYSDLGVKQQYLNDRDVIIFHFTDDYNVEHQHRWKTDWSYDETAHWHACDDWCPITDNTQKDGYGLHTPGDWIIDNAATGVKHKECTVCGYITESTSDHVHSWGAGVITKAPTCTEAGVRTYTCGCGETKTESIPATGHKYGAWTTTTEATVFAPAVQTRTCSVCGNKETQNAGSALKATIKVNANTLPLKVKQKTSVFKVTGLANGDSVQSYKSSNTKIFTVTKNGVIKAGKKTGKATLTITLASGLQKKVTVKVQKKTVTTSKITGLQKKVTLKKGAKLTLTPSLTPITSTQKFTYKTSNKKIATVSKKGVITAKKAGKTKITVKSGKKKYTVTVTVTK